MLNRPRKTGGPRLVLYGDSLATNLYQGLRLVPAHKALACLVSRRARRGSGLVRTDQFDWPGHLRRYALLDHADVIVASFGGNDRQAMAVNGRSVPAFSSQWWREYDRRLSRVMRTLTATGARVFWLGIPIVRSTKMSEDLVGLNRFIRARATGCGIIHIDIWDGFRDAHDRYTDFNCGDTGTRRRQRHLDGIHFAPWGQKRLAEFVLAAIERPSDH